MILVALEIILIFPMSQLLIRTFLVLISYPVISDTTRTEIFRLEYNTYKKSINYYIINKFYIIIKLNKYYIEIIL